MNKSLLKSTLAFAAALILFTACKKDKDSVAVTKESVTGSYKLMNITVAASSGGGEQSAIADCQKDDIYTFSSNGVYSYQDGANECGGGDWEGDWNVTNSTTIEIDGDAYQVVSFDGSTLVYSETYEMSGINITEKTTLKKQ